MVELPGIRTVVRMEYHPLFVALFGAFFGAITASFLCVVAERVPNGRGIGGRSTCACGRQLRNRENIPIVGYLRTGGVASCCGAILPPVYLWAELALTISWAVAALTGTRSLSWSVIIAGVTAGSVVLYAAKHIDGGGEQYPSIS